MKFHVWETVQEVEGLGAGAQTRRMRVPGGWIYLYCSYETRNDGETAEALSTVFVPYSEEDES